MNFELVSSRGRVIKLGELTPADIDIWEVAEVLSKICRYGGRTNEFYSVAEHCVKVAEACEERGASPKTCLLALLHDLPEAFTGDIVAPIRDNFTNPVLKNLERTVDGFVTTRYGLTVADSAFVNQIDKRIVADEMARFCDYVVPGLEPLDVPFQAWAPTVARDMFLDAFYQYWDGELYDK